MQGCDCTNNALVMSSEKHKTRFQNILKQKKMYRKSKLPQTKMRIDESYIGETIEQKVRRVTLNREPIKDGAEMIYTDRTDGVQPDYNIRTDKWEVAVEGMDKVDKTRKAIRRERHKSPEEKEKDRLAAEAAKNMGKEGETQVENN